MKKSGQYEIVQKVLLTLLTQKDATYVYMNNLKSLPTEEIACSTKKTKLKSKCRHQSKYMLSKYDDDTTDGRQMYCRKPLYCNFPFVKHIRRKIPQSLTINTKVKGIEA